MSIGPGVSGARASLLVHSLGMFRIELLAYILSLPGGPSHGMIVQLAFALRTPTRDETNTGAYGQNSILALPANFARHLARDFRAFSPYFTNIDLEREIYVRHSLVDAAR